MLTDLQCRNAKARDKAYKLADERGLYLYVTPTGFRSWRLKYRIAVADKLVERRLIIGPYPEVSLTEAREAREVARKQVKQGLDPGLQRKREKAARAIANANTFRWVAQEWHTLKAHSLAPRYARQILFRLEADVYPAIGEIPIASVTAADVLEVIRSIEKRGSREMAHKVRSIMSEVFVHAISTGRSTDDPAHVIRRALAPRQARLWPALTKLEDARAALEVIESRRAWWATLLASRLIALTASRPGVVRLAEKSEFEDLDGESPLWRIPAAKMKLSADRKQDDAYEFVVPLARQSAELVKRALRLSTSKTLVFPSSRLNKPVADATLSLLYRQAGLTGKLVPHGWRATFSTIMNERAAVDDRDQDRAIIDLMLAHTQSGVEPIYNRAAYMPRRRELAQEWADILLKGQPSAGVLVKR